MINIIRFFLRWKQHRFEYLYILLFPKPHLCYDVAFSLTLVLNLPSQSLRISVSNLLSQSLREHIFSLLLLLFLLVVSIVLRLHYQWLSPPEKTKIYSSSKMKSWRSVRPFIFVALRLWRQRVGQSKTCSSWCSSSSKTISNSLRHVGGGPDITNWRFSNYFDSGKDGSQKSCF